jgi:hypothetical protein
MEGKAGGEEGVVSNSAKALGKDIGTACADCPARNRKPRSYEQHKRYFALMKATLPHWPDTHERVFANEVALRKWLQMKAGHCTSKAVDLYGIPEKKARLIVEATLAAAAPYSESRVMGRNLVIFTPLSINYDTLGHKDFCDLNNAVDEIIWAETGLNPDQLLQEQGKAA